MDTLNNEDEYNSEYRPIMTGNSPIRPRKLTKNTYFSDETWKRIHTIPFESTFQELPTNPTPISQLGSSKDRYKKKLYELKIQRGNKNKKH